MVFRYRAYELNFVSELEPPSMLCPVQVDVSHDVNISFGDVVARLACPSIENNYYQVSPREFLLTIPNVARYYVANGCKIIVSPFQNADPDKVRLFLFGSALGALLYQRGLFPLHGSAVVTKYGVMIFVGPQGIGKSTLAAHFQKRGYTLLSDDVCAITNDASGNFLVLPAFPQIRLCPDAHERLDTLNTNSVNSRFDVDKFVVSSSSGHSYQSAKLCAVHLLADGELPTMLNMQVQGFDSVNILLTNLYRPGYLRGFDTMEHVMKCATIVAQRACISKIVRPRDPSRIEEVIDWIIKEWDSNQNYLPKGEKHTVTAETNV